MAQFLQTQGMSKKPTSYLDVLKQKEQEKKKINLFDFSDVKPTQSTQTPQINFGQPVSQRNVTNFTDYQSTLPKQQPTTQKSSGFSIIPTAKASDGKMSLQEFGDMIKKKYPDYNEIDSNELGRKMLEKFPDYNDVVDINIQPQPQDFSAEQNLIKNLGERYKQFTTAKDEGPLRTLTKGALPFDLQKTGALGKAFGDILGYGLEKSLSPEMKKTIVDTIGEDNLKKLDKLGQIIKSQEQTIKKVPGGAEAIDIGKNVLATSDLIGTGIAGKGLVTGGAKVLTKGGKVLSKGVGKITPDLQKTASTVSTKANRFNAVDEEKFIKTTGQTPGEFAVERGMTEVGDKAVEKATQNYLTSIKQADDAFENVGGNFKYTGKGNDPIKLSIDDLETRGIKTEADYTPRIQELKAKYETEGLTMPEINEIKREYARNFKYGFEDRNSEALARSTNIQNRLREWQLNKADEMGVSNIRDINKNTQAWKLYADALEKKLNRSGANNAVGITDWIALSGGNPTNVALFLGKKLGTSDKAKELLIKTLGKKTKGAIITPDINKPQIKGLLPKGPVITPAPKFKSGIKVTPATIQPNVKTQKALPPGKVVTPQTIEKGIIQESKITLKNTKYGTNNNISSNMNNTRTDKLLKPNQPTNVSNKPLQKTTETGRGVLKKILPSNFKEKAQDFIEGIADKVGARQKLLGGEGAKQVPTTLEKAKNWEKSGKSADEIWKETGWERGTDGKWRFEIDDSNAKVLKTSKELDDWQTRIGIGKTLPEVLEHPTIYKQYPEIKDLRVKVDFDGNGGGSFDEASGVITVNGLSKGLPISQERIKSTLLHEIQHYIQSKEGFAIGGRPSKYINIEGNKQLDDLYSTYRKYGDYLNDIKSGKEVVIDKGKPYQQILTKSDIERMRDKLEFKIDNLEQQLKQEVEKSNFTDYKSLAGETEARNVQSRLLKTSEERKLLRPAKTEDVAREKQIVKMEGGKAMSIDKTKLLKPSDDLISESKIPKDIIEESKNSSFLIKKEFNPKEIYRGVGGSGEGVGTARYGQGLYTTSNKSLAKQFAGKDGRLLEMDRYKDIPSKPAWFATHLDFNNFIQYDLAKKMGLKSYRQVEDMYDDLSDLFLDLGFDGIVIGKGKDNEIVKFFKNINKAK